MKILSKQAIWSIIDKIKIREIEIMAQKLKFCNTFVIHYGQKLNIKKK